MELSMLDTISILFGIAAILGLINHHLFKLPFTIGMTFSALLASLLVVATELVFPQTGVSEVVRQTITDIDFTYTLLHGMLGVLLFAGALHTDIDALRERAAPVATLAVLGTAISTLVMGTGTYFLFQALDFEISLIFCMVFGALIAPTDPIAVLGIMRAAGAPKSLEIKVIGESLFNDGLGVVSFAVLVGVATGGGLHGGEGEAASAGMVLGLLAQEVIGGVLLGLVTGYATYRALRTLDQPNLEILISVGSVMLLNTIAFKLHTSSPLACVIAGLFIGNRGRTLAMSERTRKHLDIVWSFIDEALNAILFLLIGVELLQLTFSVKIFTASLVMIPMALLARFIGVAVPITALKFVRQQLKRGSTRILTWGGLKGGISVALAMSLPPFEGREVILAATYAIVIFSILVQGMTVGALIERIIPTEEREPTTPHQH